MLVQQVHKSAAEAMGALLCSVENIKKRKKKTLMQEKAAACFSTPDMKLQCHVKLVFGIDDFIPTANRKSVYNFYRVVK
jgi:hypothetical protein